MLLLTGGGGVEMAVTQSVCPSNTPLKVSGDSEPGTFIFADGTDQKGRQKVTRLLRRHENLSRTRRRSHAWGVRLLRGAATRRG